MNKRQRKAIEVFRLKVLLRTPQGYDFKTFDVEDLGHSISVYAELGPPDSKDTMAEVFCHHHFLATIGPRGGLKFREL